MKNLVKYLLAISLLSNAYVFGGDTGVPTTQPIGLTTVPTNESLTQPGGSSPSTPTNQNLTAQPNNQQQSTQLTKNDAFDALFDGDGKLKTALVKASDNITTTDNFVTDLGTQAKQIADLIYINDQDEKITDTNNKEFTILENEKIKGRIASLNKLRTLYKDEFKRFKKAYADFTGKDANKAKELVKKYTGGDDTKAKLQEKYKGVIPATTDKNTIALFVELVTLHALAPQEVEEEIVNQIINETFSGPRHAALKGDLIQSCFKSDESQDESQKEPLKNFWVKQIDEAEKSTERAIKEAGRLKRAVANDKSPLNTDKSIYINIHKTAKLIGSAVRINTSLLKDKEAFQTKVIKPLKERTEAITTQLKSYFSSLQGNDDTPLTFIKDFTGKSKESINTNLEEYFPKTESQTPTKVDANVLKILAELHFIADVVPGVTLKMIKSVNNSMLKLADTQYGYKLRITFFPQHASTREKASNWFEKNPKTGYSLGATSAAALAAIAAGSVAYYKGRKTGLGTWKTIKKWLGMLNIQDKAEIAASCSSEQIKGSFNEDSATEILAIQKAIAAANK